VNGGEGEVYSNIVVDKGIANFLNHAKGSAGELRTQIYIGMDIGYIEREQENAGWVKLRKSPKCFCPNKNHPRLCILILESCNLYLESSYLRLES